MKRFLLCALLVGSSLSAQTVVTLDQAVSEAINHNLDLIAAKFDISVAEARLLTARLRPNPVLSLSADHLDLLGTGYNLQNAAGPTEYAARTDFLLERAGKRSGRIAVAEMDRTIAQLNVLNTTRTIILGIENAFVDVLSAKEALLLAEQSRDAMRGIVRVNTERVRTGDLAQVELLRTQVAQLQFETAVSQAKLRLAEAQTRLLTLMGRPAGSPVEFSGELRRDIDGRDLPALLQVATAHRPDYIALQRTQARTQADIRLQTAQGKIDYTLGSEYRRQQGLAGTGNSLGFFVTVPIPVFNRNQGEIERARREADQATARLKALDLSLRAELNTAFETYQSSLALLKNLETNMLDQARQVRTITEYSYRRGEASLVELLDAQRAFNEAMQSYNDARANFARSLYQLDSITAGNLSTQVTP